VKQQKLPTPSVVEMCSFALNFLPLFHVLTFVQRAVEILIKQAAVSSPLPPVTHSQKNGSEDASITGVTSVGNRNGAAIPVATVPRQRRIRDSDDDDDDIPVFRGASAAVLPTPKSKLAQALASNDDDEIVLLRMTQASQHSAISSHVASSTAPHLDVPAIQRDSDPPCDHKSTCNHQDDDAPMVALVESAHAAREGTPTAASPAVKARTAAAVRPKLKGLGSLVRRLQASSCRV
jgi:hypothetical protein